MTLTNQQIAIVGAAAVLVVMIVLKISPQVMLIVGGVGLALYLFATQTDAGKKLLAQVTGKVAGDGSV